MYLQGHYTQKGLALSAKLLSGKALDITRVTAGGGQTEITAATLAQECQELSAGNPSYSGFTATIPATLLAAQAAQNYTLTELGVYADDPDEGEVLYKFYRLDAPLDVVAGSRTVLRFYLEETVSQAGEVRVTCSPAGVLTVSDIGARGGAANYETQEKVFAKSSAYRQATVTAAELPAFIAALPRLLTENLTIHVSGTLSEPLAITGLYGSGQLSITGDTLGSCTVKDVVSVSLCSVPVVITYLAFIDSGKAAQTPYQSVVFVNHSKCVVLQNCSFTGNGTGHAFLTNGASVGWVNASTIQGFDSAVSAFANATSGAFDVTASGNTKGAHVYRGGSVFLGGTTPQLLGGTTNHNGGGLIVYQGAVI